MLKVSSHKPPASRLWALRHRIKHWTGPGMRLGSYGWAYASQFALTMVLGVDAFAIYAAATALGMLGAYGSMAGVTDLLTRQWTWLASRKANLTRTLIRFVAPRLALAFLAPAALTFIMERLGLIRATGTTEFFLLVGGFGLLSVTIDLCGVLLACLGRPSFHVITSNGLLGASFFSAAGWAMFGDGHPDAVVFQVGSQMIALAVIATWLAVLMGRALRENAADAEVASSPANLRLGVTVTAVHVLEIVRAHLPTLLIQAAFQSATASAMVASLRFSRAADVMSVLAVAQHTRAIVSGSREEAQAHYRRAQNLCLTLTLFAMVPIGTVVVTLCLRENLGLGPTAFVTAMIVGSAVIRQFTSIQIWMAKVVNDPSPALRIGLLIEAGRFAGFAMVAATGNLYAAVAVLVASDALLLVAMLNLGKKTLRHA
jgi:hypothetical protein